LRKQYSILVPIFYRLSRECYKNTILWHADNDFPTMGLSCGNKPLNLRLKFLYHSQQKAGVALRGW